MQNLNCSNSDIKKKNYTYQLKNNLNGDNENFNKKMF